MGSPEGAMHHILVSLETRLLSKRKEKPGFKQATEGDNLDPATAADFLAMRDHATCPRTAPGASLTLPSNGQRVENMEA